VEENGIMVIGWWGCSWWCGRSFCWQAIVLTKVFVEDGQYVGSGISMCKKPSVARSSAGGIFKCVGCLLGKRYKGYCQQ